jgi:hypothetical protein
MNAEMRLIGLVSAAAACRDANAMAAAFAGLPDDETDALNGAVRAHLLLVNDLPAWAWALNVMPTSGRRAAGRTLWDRLGQLVPEPSRPADYRRSTLCRIAFRLLRQGRAAKPYVSELHAANALFPEPLAAEKVDSIAVWCFERHTEKPHA